MNWDNIAVKLGYTNFKSMFIKLYNVEKMSLSDIARELGCNLQTIRRQVTLHDLESYLRPRGKLTPFLTEAELTGTIDEAAEKTGLPRSTIWYRRRRAKHMLDEMTRTMSLGEKISESETDKKDSPSESDVDPSEPPL